MTWDGNIIRALEQQSIRAFMEANRQYLRGRVLDFGAGREPYRDLVSGKYVAIEKADSYPDGEFDCVMCNQVIEYIERPLALLSQFHHWLAPNRGYLVSTYPTNWDEVEADDLWRFTKVGMELLLAKAGFRVISHARRAEINLNGFKFPLGYGVVAQAR